MSERIQRLQNLQARLSGETEDWHTVRDVVASLIELLVQDEQKVIDAKQPKCEVCGGVVDDGYDLIGCEKCGRMFGPCYNSQADGICVECISNTFTGDGDCKT